MRGLDFHDNFAIIGISKPRDNKSFVGLDLDSALIENNQTSQCGVLIVDLKSHEIIHSIAFDGLIDELYDVICIENCANPMLIGLKGEEINHTISIEA